jgi:hypothetical protein
MKLKKVLRTAIIAEWVISLLYIFATLTLETDLPAHVQEYIQWLDEVEVIATTEIVVLILFIIAALITSIGLFFFKPWAKQTYLIITITGFVIGPLISTQVVEHGLASSIGDIPSLIAGFILALLFFTDVYKNGVEQK